MPEDTINIPLLAAYEARLAALRFEAAGFVEALFLSPRPDEHQAVTALRVVPETGVQGQYPGKQWWRGKQVQGRQISALNAEVLDALEIDYAVPGDNLVIRGIDLQQFRPGDMLRIGEALLTVTPAPHRPCAKLAARTTLTKQTAMSAGRRRGLMLDACRPATIYIGDSVEFLLFSLETA